MQFEAVGTPKPDFAYYGDRPDWLVTLGVTRDADAVERSNWRFITSAIERDYPDDFAVEEMRHWAVGWVKYLLIKPDSPAVKVMSDWADQLKVYPIANDEDYEKLAAEEAEVD